MMDLLLSTLRMSTPLIFAALGGFMSERSGVINIALEGLMLIGAFTAASVTFWTHSPVLGALAAALSGAALAAFYAFFVIRLKVNEIVGGTAINLLAAGMIPFLCKIFFEVTGSTPAIPEEYDWDWAPLVGVWGIVLIVHYFSVRTPAGLWHRFAGEKPQALQSAGLSVVSVRTWGVIMSGVLAALGGMTLSVMLSSSYSRNMTAGRGFMALAALIFGKWKPIPAALACLLFGFSEAAQIRLQNFAGNTEISIPAQWIQILPYGVTLLILAGWVGKAKAPAALGKKWDAQG